MKEHLEDEVRKLQAQIEDLDRRLAVKPDYGLGAGDPAVYLWEFNLALREQILEKLEAADAAMRRLSEGTYGMCVACGGKIEAERLDLLPSTTYCAQCAALRR